MIFEIGEVHRTSPHLLADLVELHLIISNEDSISRSDVASLVTYGVIPADEIDQIEAQDANREETEAEANARAELFLDDLWAHLQYREANLGGFYPFVLDGDLLIIKRDQAEDLSNKARIYKSLLACSRLRSFERNTRSAWAKLFTSIAREAMKSLLPDDADVHIFDANSTDRQVIYGTNLRDALVKLSNTLAFDYNNDAIQEQPAAGDFGIDLVGFYRFDDGASGEHYMLGQCGAQETEWPKKTLESHPDSLRSVINLTHQGTNAMFTPVCYRQSSGRWVNSRPTGGALVVDRLRIMKLIERPERIATILAEPTFLEFENRIRDVIID
ncbi:hypothetical protein [Aeromonas hydrophila]|uniref:hypothetical protein n=1 Tax=Aeromonas hydrophila TaxID=644 RepID=UPI001F61E8DE|nr:hypothetical protein [Aeromonas hydrophila]UNU29100.1 hypothetical protein GCK65_08205 [Aeromonas hydrophila]